MREPIFGHGLCQCGCGKETFVPWANVPRYGYVKGEPRAYVKGHYPRHTGPAWVEEDCGYETPCWVWQRKLDIGGYGVDKKQRAHRLAYERHAGPISEGLQLDHLCRNRACVNPDHLEPVTCAENLRRGAGTKLTAELVRDIRRRREAGESCSSLAKRFGVAPTTISTLVRRGTWADVT
jgi:hypothetical protein